MKRAIQKNARWVVTIIGLAAIAAGVAIYIFSQQTGVRLPWEESPMRMYAELENAQAVTPGQGQTVQISGVEIGTIGEAKLEEGRAIVALDIQKKYKGLIRRDAKANLRPRTPLKDMYIQIVPGSKDAPAAPTGFTIPVANTSTDVDLDEVLSSFDRRTRDYLALLADGAGSGLKDRGKDLAEVFRRFEPTARDLRTVNEAVGREEQDLRRLVTAIADLNGELAKNPDDLAEFVDASAATFTTFASEDEALQDIFEELPSTLRQSRRTLSDLRPFARELRPATQALIPAFRALDRANAQLRPFARQATPIIRDEIRPFTRNARPLVRELAPAARDLSAAMPEVTRSGRVLNRFFNMLFSNPNGRESPDKADREEGYSFWFAWLFHQGVNLQSIEDANGPMRPIFLTGTCSTLENLVQTLPTAEFGLNLSPVLATQCGNPDTLSTDLTELLEEIPGLDDLLPLPLRNGGRR